MPITWLVPALFTNAGGGEVFVGVGSRCEWWVRVSRTLTDSIVVSDAPAISKSGARVLLPLMHPGYGGPLTIVKERLERLLIAQAFSKDLPATFPFHAPVLLAFREMQGWTEVAATWVSEVPFDDSQIYELADCLSSRGISQESRQAVSRRIRSWERAHGICIIRKKRV